MKNLHFIMGIKLKARIRSLAEKESLSSNAVIRKLLLEGIQRFEWKYWLGGDRKSRWKPIKDKICRKNARIPESLYNRLKRLHMDCNVYSMGQIVRKILEVVLIIIEKEGFGYFVDFLEEGCKKYGKKKVWLGKVMHMHYNEASKTIFSTQTKPISVEFH